MSKEKLDALLNKLQAEMENMPEAVRKQLQVKIDKVINALEALEELNGTEVEITDDDLEKCQKVIEANHHLGEYFYQVSQVEMLDVEKPWESLTDKAKAYFTTLAMKLNIDPENAGCTCMSCMLERYDELQEESPEQDQEELPEVIKGVLNFLKSQGINPDQVEVVSMSKDKKVH